MLITIPASAEGGACTTSVLDLEPLLSYVRKCRPDALSLMPPNGPDDLPNGAALLTIKNRLEAEGLRVIAGTWEIPAGATVEDPGWQVHQLFDARWLIAALGEAGVNLLPIRWAPSYAVASARAALCRYLEGVLEEAERSDVFLALYVGAAEETAAQVLRDLESRCLGVCFELSEPALARESVRHWRGSLLAVDAGPDLPGALARTMGGAEPAADLTGTIQALAAADFTGPLLLRHLHTPAEYAAAVGFVRGALAAQPRPVPA